VQVPSADGAPLGDCLLIRADRQEALWAWRSHLSLSEKAAQRLDDYAKKDKDGIGVIVWCEGDRTRGCGASPGCCDFAHVAHMRASYSTLRCTQAAPRDGRQPSTAAPVKPRKKLVTPPTPPTRSGSRRASPQKKEPAVAAKTSPTHEVNVRLSELSTLTLSREECAKLIDAVDKYDALLCSITRENGLIDGAKLTELHVGDEAVRLLQRAYDHIMSELESERYKSRYGSRGFEGGIPREGQPVPAYFANVCHQSIHRRKVLSLAGLRNLARLGPDIYRELAATHFSGAPEAYGPRDGMNKMRYYTGNVVDLDTTVLRCSDRTTLAAINAMNRCKGDPEWSSTHEFGDSLQAREIAAAAAGELCERFAADLELSEEEAQKRAVWSTDISAEDVPMACHNTDRGRWPLWHYRNVGQDSFHANVPTMSDVTGALLRAPFHCARIWASLHAMHQGEELQARIDAFFEDAVADTCFNQKWRAVEEHAAALAREGCISDVLARLQQQHQKVFAPIFDVDDAECSREKAEMWRLAAGLMGRDKSGTLRPLREEDIAQWVDDPGAEI